MQWKYNSLILMLLLLCALPTFAVDLTNIKRPGAASAIIVGDKDKEVDRAAMASPGDADEVEDPDSRTGEGFGFWPVLVLVPLVALYLYIRNTKRTNR